jgi:predicted house-cleaning noncanonical NTP pyrophosphatase (MazG superfamily)
MSIPPPFMPNPPRPTGKLVRDKIGDIMRADGVEASEHVLTDDSIYDNALRLKLVEEATEAAEEEEAGAQLGEMADVYEVLRARARLRGLTMEDIERLADAKVNARGGFDRRLWIDNV